MNIKSSIRFKVFMTNVTMEMVDFEKPAIGDIRIS